ncbi:hypothetical protein ACJMK2_028434, partial [Sinanodonta woodiana]
DKKVQPSSPIKIVIAPHNLLIPHQLSNKHDEVLRITLPQETLQPTSVYTEQ